MKKPVIGILVPSVELQAAGGVTCPAIKVSASYVEAVQAAGGLPVLVPFTGEKYVVRGLLTLCHGAILPGGDDVDPRFFGEEPHPLCGPMDTARDAWELETLRYLWENKMPALGICRGCQIMNIFAGGTIYQDLSLAELPVILHRINQPLKQTVHAVTLASGSRLRTLLKSEKVYTNSSHHQAVNRLGRGFSATGYTADGVIEAIEHENGIWMGIQWHPEVLPEHAPIFRDFIERSTSLL